MFDEIEDLTWTDELVASIWDYYSRRPEAYFTYQFGDAILRETGHFIAPDAKVCDYGCGAGFLLRHLLRQWPSAGVDFSHSNLAKAAEVIEGGKKLIGLYHTDDTTDIAGEFDVVFFVETVEHLLDPHVAPTMETLRQLLKPGGRIICTTPNDENLAEQEVFCPVTRKTFHRYQHVRSFTGETLAEMFDSNGFDCVRTFTTDFAARTLKARLKAKLRPHLGKKNPHLVYVGTPRAPQPVTG